MFVARFIGRSNLIDATVTAVSAGRVELTIAGQPHDIVGADRALSGRAQPCSPMCVPRRSRSVRPATALREPCGSRTYLGEKTEYEVEVAGKMLQVVRFNPPPAERFGPDDAVSVRLPHEGVQLLAKEEP